MAATRRHADRAVHKVVARVVAPSIPHLAPHSARPEQLATCHPTCSAATATPHRRGGEACVNWAHSGTERTFERDFFVRERTTHRALAWQQEATRCDDVSATSERPAAPRVRWRDRCGAAAGGRSVSGWRCCSRAHTSSWATEACWARYAAFHSARHTTNCPFPQSPMHSIVLLSTVDGAVWAAHRVALSIDVTDGGVCRGSWWAVDTDQLADGFHPDRVHTHRVHPDGVHPHRGAGV